MIFQINNSGGNYSDESIFDNVLLVTTNLDSVIELTKEFFTPKTDSYLNFCIWVNDKVIFTKQIEIHSYYDEKNKDNIESVIIELRKINLYNKINSFFHNKIDVPSFENSNYGDLQIVADYFKIK
jgi:hypothetical protein